jgi:hypothetical protein
VNARHPCPPGCVDHYSVEDTANHETMPRTVTGADVYTGEPREVSVWLEQRDTADVWELVGVLEQVGRNDVEFSSYQMRELAAHIVAVADQLDATLAAREAATLADKLTAVGMESTR